MAFSKPLSLVPFLVVLLLSSFSAAHFKLQSPPERGFDEDTLPEYPCGGFNKESQTRTPFPISGGPVQIYEQHTHTNFSVILALGNNPGGDDFTWVVVPLFMESAPQEFCIKNVNIKAALGKAAMPGMNATLLVTSNGDTGPGSGLYSCADITLSSSPMPQGFSGRCTDSPGVMFTKLNPNLNPNDTAVGGGSGHSGHHSGAGHTAPMIGANFATAIFAFGAVLVYIALF